MIENLKTVRVQIRVAVGALFFALLLMLILTNSASAAPIAAWQVSQSTAPTFLRPGTAAIPGEARGASPKLKIVASNVGGATAEAPVTIIDTLPTGLTVPAGVEPAIEYINEEGFFEPHPCTVAGQTVSCEATLPITPGRYVSVWLPVAVDPSASGLLPNLVEVSSPGAALVTNSFNVVVSESLPPFDFTNGTEGLRAAAYNAEGEPAVAGSHPVSVVVSADLPSLKREFGEKGLEPLQALKTLNFILPPGLVVNPRATPVRCTRIQFEGATRFPSQACPVESQIGDVTLDLLGIEALDTPLYNLVPEANAPAEIGFGFLNTNVRIRGGLNGNFRLTAGSTELLSKYKIIGARTELWGNPSDAAHDPARVGQGCSEQLGCAVERTSEPLVTMPSACSASLPFAATVTGWLGGKAEQERSFSTVTGAAEPVTGCSRLGFEPAVSIEAASKAAETPTGLSVDIKVPQSKGGFGLASATLKKAVVQLPQGMSVNPPAANGLAACPLEAIGVGKSTPASCPPTSKVGTVELMTPLLEDPLSGSVYLAEQQNNPFATLLALYVVVEGSGIVVKLPGRVDANLQTGQLTASFDNNPQLPFSELKVQFNGGNGAPRAALVTPRSCGDYLIRTEMTSWASPVPVISSIPIKIDQKCGKAGFSPALSAGTTNPVAGRYSPFTLRITRNDGEQNLAGVSTTLPLGVAAKFAGIPLCSDAAAATGNCPAASQIGTTTTGVGAGTQPLFIPQPGKAPTAVYLAGPYKGGPFSLVIRVPAQAGPFDLGTIAVRAAINVDLYTAQGSVVSDPLPQILEGIPVVYRDVRVNIDREFVLNPTSCNPKAIESRLVSNLGVVATPSVRFQVGGCESLSFQPQLKLQLKGATRRAGHPALKAIVTYPKQGAYANIARAQVGLPPSEFLDQGNLTKVCTRPELQADLCPSSSIYGHAKAWTPLLDQPLEGPVYLGVGFGYKLPALVADLNGQVRLLLKGKVDTTKKHGLRTTFEAVPDAPVSKFILEMKGGKKYGLLENSENICRKRQRASALFNAYNGKLLELQPKIAISCKSG